MRTLVQNYRSGKTAIVEVPVGPARPGTVVVKNRASLVSVGTEKSMIDFARKGLIGKALARPDLAKQVMQKVRSEGFAEAWRQSMGRLDIPVPLGYSSSGVVIEVGSNVSNISVGDRVACTGAGFSGHSEIVSCPENLSAKLPANVDFRSGAFAALGGIALESIRMAGVSLGETVAVIGLGLLGQLTTSLLRAAGVQVIGMDIQGDRADLAVRQGANSAHTDFESTENAVSRATNSAGADAVILTAATPSNEPLEYAAQMARERAKIVATALVGLQVPRQLFYEKELELVVSRAWGAGLYDPAHVKGEANYPIAYVRWTAGRNVAAFLGQISAGAITPTDLITHSFQFEDAISAYELIMDGTESHLGVVLEYPDTTDAGLSVSAQAPEPGRVVLKQQSPSAKTGVGVIGAGQFARGTLLPQLVGIQTLKMNGVAANSGLSARSVAEKFGFGYAAADVDQVLDDESIDLLVILTRHGSHADLAKRGLARGKHVFVEKPLATTHEQLEDLLPTLISAHEAGRYLAVGYNRRHSDLAGWLKKQFEDVGGPFTVNITVNAGELPGDSWIYDDEQGGGRLIGEVCHFIDLAQYFCDTNIVKVFCRAGGSASRHPTDETVTLLEFSDGSAATIVYTSRGNRSHSREHVEIYANGCVGTLDSFRRARFMGPHGTKNKKKRFGVDWGYRQELMSFANEIKSENRPIRRLEEIVNSSRALIAASQSVLSQQWVSVETLATKK